jgi:hypothetical protein
MELNWDNAKVWEIKVNSKRETHEHPKWGFDCNFKLDFDGSFIKISSRFYPPHKNSGDWWEGTAYIKFFGQVILKKEFQCSTLDGLKEDVEKFTKHYAENLRAKLLQQ